MESHCCRGDGGSEGPGVAGAVFTTGQALPITIATIALSILPIIIETRQALDPDDDEFTPVRGPFRRPFPPRQQHSPLSFRLVWPLRGGEGEHIVVCALR